MKLYLRNFTLIELLVILSIIATLVGILIPALNQAMGKVETIQCQGNMEQIYQGSVLYANDNRGVVPHSYDHDTGQSWNALVYAYLANSNEPLDAHGIEALGIECPSADKSIQWQFTTYAINANVGGIYWQWWKGWKDSYCNIYRANNPSEVFFVGEKNPRTMFGSYAIFRRSFPIIDNQDPSNYNYNVALRHNDGGIWLYLDGHVDWQSSDKSWSSNELGYEVAKTCY